MRKIIGLLLVAVVALSVALLISLRSHSNSSTPTTMTPTTMPNPSTTSTAPALPNCTVGNLAISLAQGEAGAGHVNAPLIFKNTGGTTCVMHGYPGVDGRNASQSYTQSATRASASGASTVTLAPGDSASAMVVAVNVPSGNMNTCQNFSVLFVTPPNTTGFVQVPTTMPGCPGLTVYPVVAGTTGL